MAETRPSRPSKQSSLPAMEAPQLPYQPQDPQNFRPGIGLIGCGGIAKWHLTAYRKPGYRVVALCDVDRGKAENLRDEYYPDAVVYTDYDEMLRRDDVEVVDIATHPPVRPPIVEAALLAGRHVLSQKPFVEDLEVGLRLAELADRQGLLLAVNQNGRWAPHFSYVRVARENGLLGELSAAHFAVHWNHGWVKGLVFEDVRHLILYDFAIHWFDILCCLMGDRPPRQVYASTTRSATQEVRPALLAQAVIAYDDAQATLVFDGDTRHGKWDTVYVTGSRGTILCQGTDIEHQQATLYTEQGVAQPELVGTWFPDGFHGAMGELLCAIEEKRKPANNAHDNLASLALCFAAVASAERGEPVIPGSVRKLPGMVAL